jgi:hypothetical protein
MDPLSIFFIAVVIGLLPATIAKMKGSSFFGFWVFGAVLFIVALPVAIFMKRELPPSLIACGACGKGISREATACPHCGHPNSPEKIEAEASLMSADDLRRQLELRGYRVRCFAMSARQQVRLPDGGVREFPDVKAFLKWGRPELDRVLAGPS